MRNRESVAQARRVHRFASPDGFFQTIRIIGAAFNIEGVNHLSYGLLFGCAPAFQQHQFAVEQSARRTIGAIGVQQSINFSYFVAIQRPRQQLPASSDRKARDALLNQRNVRSGNAEFIQTQA